MITELRRKRQTAENIESTAIKNGLSDFQHLLLKADATEVERLLLVIIPKHTCTLLKISDPSLMGVLTRLRDLFDLAFCLSSGKIKHAVILTFIDELNGANPRSVAAEFLFRPKYLVFFDTAPRKQMLRQLLFRLQDEMSLHALNAVDGLEEFLVDSDDLLAWLQTLVIACIAAPAESAADIRNYAKRAYGGLSQEHKRVILEKQESVIRECDIEGNSELGRLLRTLQESWSYKPFHPPGTELEQVHRRPMKIGI